MIRCVELCVEYHYHIVFATWNDCWKFFHIGTQAFNITMTLLSKRNEKYHKSAVKSPMKVNTRPQ